MRGDCVTKAVCMLVVAAVMLACAQSHAQPLQPAEPALDTPAQPSAGKNQVTKVTEGVGSGEISVTLDRFGAGGQARIGDWVGLRFLVNDTAPVQRELVMRLIGEDADGDQPAHQMSFTSNPGVAQQVWMYTRLPFSFGDGGAGTLRLSIFAGIEDPDQVGEPGSSSHRAGALLATLPVQPRAAAVVGPTIDMIGVFGSRALGLQQYADRAGVSEPFHKIANEVTEVVTGLLPEDAPDRWQGWAQYSAIVWADGDPSKLRGDRARALRDYVIRGGHLIIVLPVVGQGWTNATSNELYDIMPDVVISTKENVDFEGYRPLLSAWNGATFPKTATVQNLRPRQGALVPDAVRILNGPDNECVVVRREVGAGCVTMIGLDLNQTALSQFNFIDAEVFWNRVLGRRGELLEPVPDLTKSSFQVANATSQRRVILFDGDIASQIAKSGRSATGVLVGFVVFAIYWTIAGPLGFALLKRRSLSQHSWVFFVASSIVFTALAWGGATLLRPKRVEATHFTLLDHVFGQPVQRARMWASVLLPWYGRATLAVGDVTELGAAAQGRVQVAGRRSLSSIAPWDPPESAAGTFGGFSDTRAYPLDTRTTDVMTFPTRQTVKQVQADFVGGPRWEMPFPVKDDGSPGVGELRLNSEEAWRRSERSLVSGTLVHKMPGPLRDIVVVVVRSMRDLPRGAPRRTQLTSPVAPAHCFATAYSYREAWEPGQPLSLDAVTMPKETADINKFAVELFLQELVPTVRFDTIAAADLTSGAGNGNRSHALAFFSQLPAPDFASISLTNAAIAPQRAMTHGWDLGRWFTRPCIIIVGQLGTEEDVESPVPLLIDGEPLRNSGRTVVRWVYPLPDDPPQFPPAAGTGRVAPPGSRATPVLPETSTIPEKSGGITTPAPGL